MFTNQMVITMSHGGKREGAGRRSGSNVYGESTHPLRVPKSRIEEVKAFLTSGASPYTLPFYSSTVRAGTPTAADDHIEDHIDLNAHFTKATGSTFLVKASGDSMIDAHILDGDMLVVDKSSKPKPGKIVIAAVDGELTVKRLAVVDGVTQLLPENKNFPPIIIGRENNLIIWGTVTHIIHQAQ